MWRFALLSAVVAPSAFADTADRLIDQPPVALDAAVNVGVTGVHCSRSQTEAAFGCTAGEFDVAPSFGVNLGAGYIVGPDLHIMLRVHAGSRFTLQSEYLLTAAVDVGVRLRLDSRSALHVGLGPQWQAYGAHDSEEGDVGLGLFIRWEWTSAHSAVGFQTIPNTWQSQYSQIRVFDLSAVAAVRR